MKYAVCFMLVAAALTRAAVLVGGWTWLLLWPAASWFVAGASYLVKRPEAFGKRKNGSLNPVATLLLFPFLVVLWAVWWGLRLTQKENPFDELGEDLLIGRRLLAPELPSNVENVVDLTCEFPESKSIVNRVNYLSLPILDASIPTLNELQTFVDEIDQLKGITFIHCAQGHGRTGLVTASLLLKRNRNWTVEEAIAKLQTSRPALNCNRKQRELLQNYKDQLQGGAGSVEST